MIPGTCAYVWTVLIGCFTMKREYPLFWPYISIMFLLNREIELVFSIALLIEFIVIASWLRHMECQAPAMTKKTMQSQ